MAHCLVPMSSASERIETSARNQYGGRYAGGAGVSAGSGAGVGAGTGSEAGSAGFVSSAAGSGSSAMGVDGSYDKRFESARPGPLDRATASSARPPESKRAPWRGDARA